MKKTAVLLFDDFSNYELSVALSVLMQGGKTYDVFCLNEIAKSEEGLHVKRNKSLSELNVTDYDSLLIPGCMDLRGIIDNTQIHEFIRRFDLTSHIIASISSSPLLLLKSGMLYRKEYIAGVIKTELLEEGFTMEQMSGMRDVTELGNGNEREVVCIDGNLITAVGSGFINFGVEFGKMLGLEFDTRWYEI